MSTRVKICGVTRLEDAELAVGLGAWAVGMVLWPDSPRACDPEDAAGIATALRRRCEVAGVFVNAHLDDLVAAAEEAPLTIIQLHGDEGPAYCAEVRRRTGAKVMKAARVHDAGDVRELSAYKTDLHMLDAYVAGVPGGTGERFDWELARAHPGRPPLVLSGGLTPANVAEAISVAQPYAVDVASGVESSPGVKDHAKVRSFFEAVDAAAVHA
jgi:phosphoribosylanthranilate isomerase